MNQAKRRYRAEKALFLERLKQAVKAGEPIPRYPKHKDHVLKAYGEECANCSSRENLEIHHKLNNGKQHRLLISKGRAGNDFYAALKRRGYPNREPYLLEVLCKKCHKVHTKLNGRRKDYGETQAGGGHSG